MRYLAVCGLVSVMAGCSSGGGSGDVFDISSDVTAYGAEAARISALPEFTNPVSGSLEYEGQVVADLTNVTDGKLIGDLQLEVNFDTGGSVLGSIDNIALRLGNGQSVSSTGSLDISGTEVDNAFTADATGTIRSADEAGVVGDTSLDLDLSGDLRADAPNPAFYGTVLGTGTGHLDLDVDGEFYAPVTNDSGT